MADAPAVAVRGEAYRKAAPELKLDPRSQPVQAAVEARFTISEPVLG
ncbi:hypothetical protein [Micromonospora sp. SL4-19]